MDESYLCIDIATNSIRVLEKGANGNILRWGILERNGRVFHSSIQPLDPGDAADALRQLLDKMGILRQAQDLATVRSAIFSVPSFCVFTATSDIVDPNLVPAVPGAYKLEASKLSNGRYFLVAVPEDITEKYQEICRLTGLRLERLEPESAAIARGFSKKPGRVMVVDVDHRLTTFTIIHGGAVEYVSHTDFGGASEALNVIMDKTREIAEKKSVRNVLFSNSVFNVVYGLQKVSQQAFNQHGRSGSIRSAY